MDFNVSITIAGRGRAEGFGERMLDVLVERVDSYGPVVSADERDAPPLTVSLTVRAASVPAAVTEASEVIEHAVDALGVGAAAGRIIHVEVEPAESARAVA